MRFLTAFEMTSATGEWHTISRRFQTEFALKMKLQAVRESVGRFERIEEERGGVA
jgi:hypothetical protein